MTQGLVKDFDGTDVFIDINTYFFRDELMILSKLQPFAGHPLCSAAIRWRKGTIGTIAHAVI